MATTNQELYQGDILETQSPNFPIEKVNLIASELYGLTGKLSPLDSERDQNFRISTETGDQFVIKIANSAENPGIIDMQLKALAHIENVAPDLPVPKVYLSKNGSTIEQIQGEDGTKHHVRILTYLEGVYPEEDPTNSTLLRSLGACLAELALALRGFFHASADYELLWDLKHTSKLRQYFCGT
jgi:Ser/Thr protein kinase RdoA (MazF antagonist)